MPRLASVTLLEYGTYRTQLTAADPQLERQDTMMQQVGGNRTKQQWSLPSRKGQANDNSHMHTCYTSLSPHQKATRQQRYHKPSAVLPFASQSHQVTQHGLYGRAASSCRPPSPQLPGACLPCSCFSTTVRQRIQQLAVAPCQGGVQRGVQCG